MVPCVFPRLFFPRARTTVSEGEALSLPLVSWSLGPGSAGGKGESVSWGRQDRVRWGAVRRRALGTGLMAP